MMNWETVRLNWEVFCKFEDFTPWMSQRAYMNSLFQNGRIEAYDRCTGKTTLVKMLILFNHKYGFFNIYFTGESRQNTRIMEREIIFAIGNNPENCEFRSEYRGEHRKLPHLEIRDGTRTFVEYRE